MVLPLLPVSLDACPSVRGTVFLTDSELRAPSVQRSWTCPLNTGPNPMQPKPMQPELVRPYRHPRLERANGLRRLSFSSPGSSRAREERADRWRLLEDSVTDQERTDHLLGCDSNNPLRTHRHYHKLALLDLGFSPTQYDAFSPHTSSVPGLSNALHAAELSLHFAAAEAWCEESGAAFLSELIEEFGNFAASLGPRPGGLTPPERCRLRMALVAQCCNDAFPPLIAKPQMVMEGNSSLPLSVMLSACRGSDSGPPLSSCISSLTSCA